MDNYYSLLGVSQTASEREIKTAFREQAKRLHPDIAGTDAGEKMRRLIAAYQALSDRARRFEYDRAYSRFVGKDGFNYRNFLMEKGDPESRAKLVFFDFLHLEDDEAIERWTKAGGLRFRLEDYLDREDWMDCSFILAEELEKRNRSYEAFVLLVCLIREERRKPYFKHFTEEIEALLRDIVRFHLKNAVDRETYAECLEILLSLGFRAKDENRWLKSLSETLLELGDAKNAENVLREARSRFPGKKPPKTGRSR
ncbi:MAG: DnaJ domain-containing protein [Treponema sp.]|jgi:curved DNA-binding protein CbpA|nr:DnaJ domain-containing protein [Treponema sp.]